MNKKSEKKMKISPTKSYWESKAEIQEEELSYPDLGEVSFKSFVGKIGLGLAFSFASSFVFFLASGGNLFNTWGVATLLVAGIYFILAGWRDWSRTSAKKSFQKYEQTIKDTKIPGKKFKFELGLLQFGNVQEDFGAALCLLGIATIIFTFAG